METEDKPVLDFQQLLQKLDGDLPLCREIAQDFDEDYRLSVTRIKACLEQEELGPVAAEIHTIRGAALNLNAIPLANAARVLEDRVRNGDSAAALGALGQMDVAYAALRRAFIVVGVLPVRTID